ncbi:ribonuclease pancreatic-like [Pelodiscus sinensis]|uniref:ribonuclease pancreatic-like n=1 Tax=Pelodiscus sinensis TaxID=13735 RepID=UPI003F6BB001
MALHGPRPASLLPLLLLLAASLALSAGQNWNPLNDLFRKRHVDSSPILNVASINAYCSKMMWRRALYGRLSNTFIIAKPEDINKVCSTEGLAKGPYRYESKNPFDIIVCIYNHFTLSYTGLKDKQKIVLSCWKGLPALYIKHVQPDLMPVP